MRAGSQDSAPHDTLRVHHRVLLPVLVGRHTPEILLDFLGRCPRGHCQRGGHQRDTQSVHKPLDFKVQAAALNGVGADLGIGHCHVGGVLGVRLERLVAFQSAVQHDIGVR